MSSPLQDIIDGLQETWYTSCWQAGSSALLVYDYIITFPDEVDLCWRCRCTAMSLLFIISRYIALVYVVAAVLVDSRWETDQSCEVVAQLYLVSAGLLTAVLAGFSALQVYAVSGRCWLPTLAVATLGVVPMGVAILDGIEEGHPFTMSLGSVSACGLTSSLSLKVYHKVVVVSRVASLLSDMIILAVTLQFVYRMRREPLMRTMQAPLPTFLVKAGVVQFMVLLALNAVQLATINAFEYISVSCFIPPATLIAMWRLFINLHQLRRSEHDNRSSTDSRSFTGQTLSTLAFIPDAAGDVPNELLEPAGDARDIEDPGSVYNAYDI